MILTCRYGSLTSVVKLEEVAGVLDGGFQIDEVASIKITTSIAMVSSNCSNIVTTVYVAEKVTISSTQGISRLLITPFYTGLTFDKNVCERLPMWSS